MSYNYYFNKYLVEFVILSDERENIGDWINVLSDEGYIYNDYAEGFLSIFGGLKVRGRGVSSHSDIEIYFNPVYYASGEYDRMSIYNNAADDILFPVGGICDYTVFIGEKGKYYIADWKNLYECAESIDSFLENIFSDDPNLLELYNNE